MGKEKVRRLRGRAGSGEEGPIWPSGVQGGEGITAEGQGSGQVRPSFPLPATPVGKLQGVISHTGRGARPWLGPAQHPQTTGAGELSVICHPHHPDSTAEVLGPSSQATSCRQRTPKREHASERHADLVVSTCTHVHTCTHCHTSMLTWSAHTEEGPAQGQVS